MIYVISAISEISEISAIPLISIFFMRFCDFCDFCNFYNFWGFCDSLFLFMISAISEISVISAIPVIYGFKRFHWQNGSSNPKCGHLSVNQAHSDQQFHWSAISFILFLHFSKWRFQHRNSVNLKKIEICRDARWKIIEICPVKSASTSVVW